MSTRLIIDNFDIYLEDTRPFPQAAKEIVEMASDPPALKDYLARLSLIDSNVQLDERRFGADELYTWHKGMKAENLIKIDLEKEMMECKSLASHFFISLDKLDQFEEAWKKAYIQNRIKGYPVSHMNNCLIVETGKEWRDISEYERKLFQEAGFRFSCGEWRLDEVDKQGLGETEIEKQAWPL